VPHDPNQSSLPGAWTPPATRSWSPYREGTIFEENTVRIDEENLVVVRFWRDGRAIVDFTLHQQLGYFGRWIDVVRVDCEHRQVHYHLMDRDGNQLKREVIREITGVGDVVQGYGIAYDWIWAEYLENRRRWHRGQ
jgi:hypothetical protein